MPYNLRTHQNSSKRSAIACYRDFVRCGNLKCKTSCVKDRIYCMVCCKWFHYECKGMSRKKFLECVRKKETYVCDGKCFASLMPFSEVEHNDILLMFNDCNLYPCKKMQKRVLG